MSISSKNTDLIKFNEKKSNLPIKFKPNDISQALELVDKDLILKNRDEVKKFLPDILGRVLARIWIDKSFKENFKSNPRQVLNDNGVFLPDEMFLEFQNQILTDPRYSIRKKTKFQIQS